MKSITKILKKLLIRVLLLCLLCALLGAAVNGYVTGSVKSRILLPEEAQSLNADCVLVLGAGVYIGGIPSPMLEDRLLQGIELYELGASERLLMSGDHGSKDYDEVNVMKNFAKDKGVPSEHIFMDHAGFSTYESLYRARDVFAAERVIIVTQRYHLYRALYIAGALGLDAFGVASDPRQYAGQDARELREFVARIKDFFYCVAKPEPTFLGEVIPVSGNGDDTNDQYPVSDVPGY